MSATMMFVPLWMASAEITPSALTPNASTIVTPGAPFRRSVRSIAVVEPGAHATARLFSVVDADPTIEPLVLIPKAREDFPVAVWGRSPRGVGVPPSQYIAWRPAILLVLPTTAPALLRPRPSFTLAPLSGAPTQLELCGVAVHKIA